MPGDGDLSKAGSSLSPAEILYELINCKGIGIL
jgi:hypothetical protein